MTVYQFSFRHHPEYEEKVSLDEISAGVLDCRVFLNDSHDGDSEEIVRSHPRFEECVREGMKIHSEHGAVAVGCHLRWMATPVSNEIVDRLRTQGEEDVQHIRNWKTIETKCNNSILLDYEVELIDND